MATFTTDFANLFEGITTISAKGGSNGTSIYKEELFKDMTQDTKKKARTKLRRTRDKFLTAFIQAKGDKKILEALKKDWQRYALQVYKQIDTICESNTEKNTYDLCKRFCEVMNTNK